MLFNNKIALIIDDSYTIRHQVKLLLKKHDITVVEAYDKNSMIKFLTVNNKPVDIILMDLGLKETTGFDLMEYLRSRDDHKDTPIIVLTGDAKKRTVIAASNYQLSFYAIKPINPQDLLSKVFTALENASSKKVMINNSDELEQALEGAKDQEYTKLILNEVSTSLSQNKSIKQENTIDSNNKTDTL